MSGQPLPKLSPQLMALVNSAKANGYTVTWEETPGAGLRIYRHDGETYTLGVWILVTETGAFLGATRLDVDQSITTMIRTIKVVKRLLEI